MIYFSFLKLWEKESENEGWVKKMRSCVKWLR